MSDGNKEMRIAIIAADLIASENQLKSDIGTLENALKGQKIHVGLEADKSSGIFTDQKNLVSGLAKEIDNLNNTHYDPTPNEEPTKRTRNAFDKTTKAILNHKDAIDDTKATYANLKKTIANYNLDENSKAYKDALKYIDEYEKAFTAMSNNESEAFKNADFQKQMGKNFSDAHANIKRYERTLESVDQKQLEIQRSITDAAMFGGDKAVEKKASIKEAYKLLGAYEEAKDKITEGNLTVDQALQAVIPDDKTRNKLLKSANMARDYADTLKSISPENLDKFVTKVDQLVERNPALKGTPIHEQMTMQRNIAAEASATLKTDKYQGQGIEVFKKLNTKYKEQGIQMFGEGWKLQPETFQANSIKLLEAGTKQAIEFGSQTDFNLKKATKASKDLGKLIEQNPNAWMTPQMKEAMSVKSMLDYAIKETSANSDLDVHEFLNANNIPIKIMEYAGYAQDRVNYMLDNNAKLQGGYTPEAGRQIAAQASGIAEKFPDLAKADAGFNNIYDSTAKAVKMFDKGLISANEFSTVLQKEIGTNAAKSLTEFEKSCGATQKSLDRQAAKEQAEQQKLIEREQKLQQQEIDRYNKNFSKVAYRADELGGKYSEANFPTESLTKKYRKLSEEQTKNLKQAMFNADMNGTSYLEELGKLTNGNGLDYFKGIMSNVNDIANETKNHIYPGMADFEKRMSQVEQLSSSITDNLQNWTKAKKGRSSDSYLGLEEDQKALEKLAQETSTGMYTNAQFDARYNNIKRDVAVNRSDIKESGENKLSLMDKAGQALKRLGGWYIATQGVVMAGQAAKAAVNNVVQLDTAMTELKKVTEESDASYSRFMTQAGTRAKKVGSTMTDVVTATADFARLGYSMSEASNIADAALIYKNVGDGISSVSEASESIISTMQAFSIDSNQAMSIVDKFNAVGKVVAQRYSNVLGDIPC